MSKKITSYLNPRFILVIISFITSFAGIFTIPVVLNTERQITGVVTAVVISAALLALLLLSAFFCKRVIEYPFEGVL